MVNRVVYDSDSSDEEDGVLPELVDRTTGPSKDEEQEEEEQLVATRLSFEGSFKPHDGSRISKKLPGRAGQKAPGAAVLGKAKSTTVSVANSVNFFNIWLGEIEDMPDTFADLRAAHVEGEGLNDMLWAFGAAVTTMPIPINATKGFLPKENSNSKKQMGFPTIKTHMGNVKNALRDRFPDHPYWPKCKTDNPESFKLLVSQMETEYKRNLQQKWSKSPELEWGTHATKPLYSTRYFGDRDRGGAKSGDWEFDNWFREEGVSREDGDYFKEGQHWGPRKHPRLTTNLETIMKAQFLCAHYLNPKSYNDAFRTILTWIMVCRGGEVANCKWHECEDHPNWQALGFVKHQQKFLTNGQLVVVPMHAESFLLCTHFWMGNYIFLGDGLYRSPQQMADGKGNAIFPDDYRRTSSAVSQSIGANLKKFLSPHASKDLKDSITQRSLRQGAINEISCHPRSGLLKVAGRSGHKTPGSTLMHTWMT